MSKFSRIVLCLWTIILPACSLTHEFIYLRDVRDGTSSESSVQADVSSDQVMEVTTDVRNDADDVATDTPSIEVTTDSSPEDVADAEDAFIADRSEPDATDAAPDENTPDVLVTPDTLINDASEDALIVMDVPSDVAPEVTPDARLDENPPDTFVAPDVILDVVVPDTFVPDVIADVVVPPISGRVDLTCTPDMRDGIALTSDTQYRSMLTCVIVNREASGRLHALTLDPGGSALNFARVGLLVGTSVRGSAEVLPATTRTTVTLTTPLELPRDMPVTFQLAGQFRRTVGGGCDNTGIVSGAQVRLALQASSLDVRTDAGTRLLVADRVHMSASYEVRNAQPELSLMALPTLTYGGGDGPLGCWTLRNRGEFPLAWRTMVVNIDRRELRSITSVTIRDLRLMQGGREFPNAYSIVDANLRSLKTNTIISAQFLNVEIILATGAVVNAAETITYCLNANTVINDRAEAGPITFTFPRDPGLPGQIGRFDREGMDSTLRWMNDGLPGPQLVVGTTPTAPFFGWSDNPALPCNWFSGGLTSDPAAYVLSP